MDPGRARDSTAASHFETAQAEDPQYFAGTDMINPQDQHLQMPTNEIDRYAAPATMLAADQSTSTCESRFDPFYADWPHWSEQQAA